MLINSKKEITVKEVMERTNEAYDRGGADVLKVILDTLDTLAAKKELEKEILFCRYIVEAVRQQLQEAVENQKHDVIPEENLVKEV
jgi:hypothetical protein